MANLSTNQNQSTAEARAWRVVEEDKLAVAQALVLRARPHRRVGPGSRRRGSRGRRRRPGRGRSRRPRGARPPPWLPSAPECRSPQCKLAAPRTAPHPPHMTIPETLKYKLPCSNLTLVRMVISFVTLFCFSGSFSLCT